MSKSVTDNLKKALQIIEVGERELNDLEAEGFVIPSSYRATIEKVKSIKANPQRVGISQATLNNIRYLFRQDTMERRLNKRLSDEEERAQAREDKLEANKRKKWNADKNRELAKLRIAETRRDLARERKQAAWDRKNAIATEVERRKLDYIKLENEALFDYRSKKDDGYTLNKLQRLYKSQYDLKNAENQINDLLSKGLDNLTASEKRKLDALTAKTEKLNTVVYDIETDALVKSNLKYIRDLGKTAEDIKKNIPESIKNSKAVRNLEAYDTWSADNNVDLSNISKDKLREIYENPDKLNELNRVATFIETAKVSLPLTKMKFRTKAMREFKKKTLEDWGTQAHVTTLRNHGWSDDDIMLLEEYIDRSSFWQAIHNQGYESETEVEIDLGGGKKRVFIAHKGKDDIKKVLNEFKTVLRNGNEDEINNLIRDRLLN